MMFLSLIPLHIKCHVFVLQRTLIELLPRKTLRNSQVLIEKLRTVRVRPTQLSEKHSIFLEIYSQGIIQIGMYTNFEHLLITRC